MLELKRTYVNGGGIVGLSRLLNEWIEAQAAYTSAMEQDDCPWWYNEIAVTGFLAGAAWRLGGVALQEYRTSKGRLKKDRWMGRCDLYTYVGKDAFVFEIKHYRTNIGLRTGRSLEHIAHQLDLATTDAKQHSASDGIRLGICFAAPFFSAKRVDSSEQIIRDWCAAISSIKHSAIAWYFPTGIESLRGAASCVFPGVAALIRRG